MDVTDIRIQDYLVEIVVAIGTIALSIVLLVRLSCTTQREIPGRPVGTVSQQSSTREVPEDNTTPQPTDSTTSQGAASENGQSTTRAEVSTVTGAQVSNPVSADTVREGVSSDTRGQGGSVFVVKGFNGPDKPSVVKQFTVCGDHRSFNPDKPYPRDNLDTYSEREGEVLLNPRLRSFRAETMDTMDGESAQADRDGLPTAAVPVSKSSNNSTDPGSKTSSPGDHRPLEGLQNHFHVSPPDQCETRLEPATCELTDSSPAISLKGHISEAVSVHDMGANVSEEPRPFFTDAAGTEGNFDGKRVSSESYLQGEVCVTESNPCSTDKLCPAMAADKAGQGAPGRKASLTDDNGNDVIETKWGIDSEELLSFTAEYNRSDLTRLGNKARNRRPQAFIETDNSMTLKDDSQVVEMEPNRSEHRENHALFADHGDTNDDHVLSPQAGIAQSTVLEKSDSPGSERDAIADRPIGSHQDVFDIEKDSSRKVLEVECVPKSRGWCESIGDTSSVDDALLDHLTQVNYEHSKRADNTLRICKDNLPNFDQYSDLEGDVFCEQDFDSFINELVDGNKSVVSDDSVVSDSSEATTVIDCFSKSEKTPDNSADDSSLTVNKRSSSAHDVNVDKSIVDPQLADDRPNLINECTEQESLSPCGSSNIDRLKPDDTAIIAVGNTEGRQSHLGQDTSVKPEQEGLQREASASDNSGSGKLGLSLSLTERPVKGLSVSNPDLTEVEDMTANMFQASKTFWLNKSSPSVVEYEDEEFSHDQDTGYSTATNSPERTRRQQPGSASGPDSIKVTRRLITLRRSNSSTGSSNVGGRSAGTSLRRTQSSASNDASAPRVRLRRHRHDGLPGNNPPITAINGPTKNNKTPEDPGPSRNGAGFDPVTEDSGRERTGSVVQEQVRRFSNTKSDDVANSQTTSSSKTTFSGMPLSVTIQTKTRPTRTVSDFNPVQTQVVPIIDKGKSNVSTRPKSESALTDNTTRKSTKRPPVSTGSEAVKTEIVREKTPSLVREQVRRFSQPDIPDVSHFQQAVKSPSSGHQEQQAGTKTSTKEKVAEAGVNTAKNNDVNTNTPSKASKSPETVPSASKSDLSAANKDSSPTDISKVCNQTAPVSHSVPTPQAATPAAVRREPNVMQDTQKRNSKILQEQMDDYKQHVKSCLEGMTKQLDNEREEKLKAKEWCSFLESELDAHINARIVAEERQYKLRAKSRSLTMKYRALQTRCDQLEQYLTSKGVNIDDVIQPHVALADSRMPAEFLFLEQVAKQESKTPGHSARDRQVFGSVEEVQAYWQDQFAALSAKRGPNHDLKTLLANVQSTTKDPDELFLEQMALYNQFADPKYVADPNKPGSASVKRSASDRVPRPRSSAQTTPVKVTVRTPSTETPVAPETGAAPAESRPTSKPTHERQPAANTVPVREPAPTRKEPVTHKTPERPTSLVNENGEEACVKVSQALRMWEQKMSPTKGHSESRTRLSPPILSPTTEKVNDSPGRVEAKLQQWEETLTHHPARQSPPSPDHPADDVPPRGPSRPGGAAVSKELLDQWEDVVSGKARPPAPEDHARSKEPEKSEDDMLLQELIDMGNTDVMADSIRDIRQTKAKWETLFANGNQADDDINLGSSNEFERSTHFTDLKSKWQNFGDGESNC